jgi:hypothetical protein
MEVSANRENHTPASRQTAECLTLGTEIVMLDCFVFLGGVPAEGLITLRILAADRLGPRKRVIDLKEVVVLIVCVSASAGIRAAVLVDSLRREKGLAYSLHGPVRLHSPEKIHHALFQFLFISWNVS